VAVSGIYVTPAAVFELATKTVKHAKYQYFANPIFIQRKGIKIKWQYLNNSSFQASQLFSFGE
jgi:hypothetical protein